MRRAPGAEIVTPAFVHFRRGKVQNYTRLDEQARNSQKPSRVHIVSVPCEQTSGVLLLTAKATVYVRKHNRGPLKTAQNPYHEIKHSCTGARWARPLDEQSDSGV